MYTKITAVAVFSVALVAGAWKCYVVGRHAGRAEIKEAWDAQIAEDAITHAKAERAARETERALHKQIDVIGRKRNEQIALINRRHAALVDSLRNRPAERTEGGGMSSIADAAADGSWCTGARLYREHADAFAREASVAEKVQADLKTCVAAYEKARQKQP